VNSAAEAAERAAWESEKHGQISQAQQMMAKTLELRAANHAAACVLVDSVYTTVLAAVEDNLEQGYCLFSPEGMSQSETDLLRDKLENEGFTVTHTPSFRREIARKDLRIDWMDAGEILL